MKEKWNCHYCNRSFNSFFDRDMHHRSHPQHYENMFKYMLQINYELEFQIKILQKEVNKLRKETDKRKEE